MKVDNDVDDVNDHNDVNDHDDDDVNDHNVTVFLLNAALCWDQF